MANNRQRETKIDAETLVFEKKIDMILQEAKSQIMKAFSYEKQKMRADLDKPKQRKTNFSRS
jgi:hypothetical protein